MSEIYARDFDLNLLRVFAVVAKEGSVTRAAHNLYLTQPAVSAALARLSRAVGTPLFRRQGRGIVLTPRGERLSREIEPLLRALVDATLAEARFDPRTSERVVRIGISDALEGELLAPLLRVLAAEAPRMRLIALPVQFRTVGALLTSRQVDMAVTVADELPSSIRRLALFRGNFCCLYDARHLRLPARLSERDYFAQKHAIVSYNGDLRGVVEDMLHKQRDVRCAVANFAQLGAVLNGSPLLATVPSAVARHLRELYPALRTKPLPFAFEGGAPLELLWPERIEEDDSFRFVRDHLVRIAKAVPTGDFSAKKRTGAARKNAAPARAADGAR